MSWRTICTLLAVCASPSLGAAQVQSAAPSSLATLPAVVPSVIADAAIGGDSVRFAIRTFDGFRLVSDTEGPVGLRADDPHVLPVTVSLGPDLAAGSHVAGHVVYTAPGIADTVALELHVEIRRGLLVSLAGEQRAAPGSRLRLHYELANSGNVADSVTVDLETQLGRVRGGARTMLLQPFQTVQGEFEVDVAQNTLPGPSLAVLKATGNETAGFASLEVIVGRGEEGFLASLVTVPTRLFLGSSARSGDVGSAFGLQAAGDLRSGLRLTVSAHDSRDETSAFAFRGLQFGPRFRAQLASRSFSTQLGDVASRTASFAGYRLQGRGGMLEVGGGPLRFSAHAARPAGDAGRPVGGHQLAGGFDARTPDVVVGLRGVHERRDEELLAPAREMRSAYVRLEPARPSIHAYFIEAGWMALKNRSTGAENRGPAISGRYSYRNGSTIVDAQLRRRPTVAGVRSAGADELRIGGLS
ncbi:MAG: hypothetical protein OEM96_08430, partial [Gemmatimonadota bacterium]|nr:hypothetical protein [Gemmatimonadota bacterium]